MSADCCAKIACVNPAVVSVKLNDKTARAILCCEPCLKELEQLCVDTGSVIVEKKELK